MWLLQPLKMKVSAAFLALCVLSADAFCPLRFAHNSVIRSVGEDGAAAPRLSAAARREDVDLTAGFAELAQTAPGSLEERVLEVFNRVDTDKSGNLDEGEVCAFRPCITTS